MNIMKYKNIYFAISLAFLLPGLFFLFRYGLKPSIDFTGGSLLEISGENLPSSREEISSLVGDEYEINSVAQSGANQIIIRGKAISNENKDMALNQLSQEFGPVEEIRFETVGPILGKELLFKTFVAIAIVSVIITLYVWKQFDELKYGVCAIIAMFHDSLILLGAFSFLGFFFGVEADILFVTAILTTLSFSVHDTIVVFDRIRELRGKNVSKNIEEVVNAAVLETLSRSINNSMTIIIMLSSLALVGGETIRWFAVALLIGAVTGTYSSTFTAAPLILLWEELEKKKRGAR